MRYGLLLLCVLPLVLTGERSAWADDPYEAAKTRYEQDLRTFHSLSRRFGSWSAFAATKDARALAVLAERYRDLRVPKPQERYLLADVCARTFVEADHVAAWEAWTRRSQTPVDAWLHFGASRATGPHVDIPARLDVARGAKRVVVRAAALQGFAEIDPVTVAPVALAWLDDLPRSSFDRSILVHAAAYVASKAAEHSKHPVVRALFERLLDLAESEDTSARERHAILRHLAHALELDDVPTNTVYLRDALDGSTAAPAEANRYGRPRFMGIEASGTRLCYVIDLSDSMCTPLTDREREALQGPVTPSEGGAAPAVAPRGPVLPWDRIHTRYDVAREYLKASILDLSKQQSFAVVTFGSRAELLPECSGMRPWSKAYARKVAAALDRIRPSSATADRPHGRLRGDTNLHGGMRTAFQVVSRGTVDEGAYVQRQAFEQGCDTVFLLTDGAPTQDDWEGTDPGMTSGGHYDRESGRRSGASGPLREATVTYVGPYAHGSWPLIDDVLRLNLFRRAEIHCVGIGEAHMGLLYALARIGLGRARRVGR